jgi:hypothetical protein
MLGDPSFKSHIARRFHILNSDGELAFFERSTLSNTLRTRGPVEV